MQLVKIPTESWFATCRLEGTFRDRRLRKAENYFASSFVSHKVALACFGLAGGKSAGLPWQQYPRYRFESWSLTMEASI